MRYLYTLTLFVVFCFVSSFAIAQSATDTYTSSGTWTCPQGVTSIDVQVWGAGGAGGAGGTSNKNGGGGGGGGAFNSATSVTVVPGTNYTITVGTGGVGAASTNGTAGGSSSAVFGATTVTANGGAGGVQYSSGANGGAGGAGGAFSGGNGANGASTYGGGGGEGACSTQNGTNGSTSTGGSNACDGGNGGNGQTGNFGAGTAGSSPGGGGGGGTKNSAGGAGANGEVRITYVDPCQNGVQDAWEAGIDCGGPDCTPCAPDNDLCANAISLACGTFDLPGSTISTTNVAHGTGCLMSNYGVWYTFVGDGTTNIIWADPAAGYDVEVALVSGSCGSLTNIGCFDGGLSGTAEGFTVNTVLGTTYYIYVGYWSSAGTSANTGDITVSRSCSDNVTCATATTLACDTTIMGSNFGAAHVAHGTGCTMEDNGNWYTFVGDGQVTTIMAKQFTGYDFEMAITSGSCGSQTNISCEDVNTTSESYTFTAALGTTYYVYIADWLSTGGAEGNFTIRRTCGNACGNDQTNDYCSDPAQLFQGGGGWSSSTTSTYTVDLPANTSSLFCGSVENNSWYEFTAAATTETFDFTNIINCALNAGVQAEVFSVTTDGSGCCTNLTSVSNCMSSGTTADGTVTATGLTIGNQYILMVDGFAGDQCDFTVTGWSATGILPVKLLEFSGTRMGEVTKLKWSTETEVNNDYFLIQKSSNGKNFIDVATVDGNGNSNVQNNYEFYDGSSSNKINYYRLKQFDFDGKYEYSKIIVVFDEDNYDLTVYPNPSRDKLFVDFNNIDDQQIMVRYIDVLGKVNTEYLTTSTNKNTYQLERFKDLAEGYYTVQFYDGNSKLIKSQKVIKQ